MRLTPTQITSFQDFIWRYYAENGRQFAWRNIDDPYAVLISEVMLQQTQTSRVITKFELWMTEFPSFEALANAPLRDVLTAWQGLGYNRRALFLHKTAQAVMNDFGGNLPADPQILVTLPGIGKNTAGSVCAFAFNQPTVFIETNIRSVYIHSFFKDKENVKDSEIEPLVALTVDKNNPREWYYALMDYGVELKQRCVNPSRKSAHHVKQSKFEGSHRQIRGAILRLLTKHVHMSCPEIFSNIKRDPVEIEKALAQLTQELFIHRDLNTDIVTLR